MREDEIQGIIFLYNTVTISILLKCVTSGRV